MPGTERTGNDELHDSRWLGAILPIILGYLQLIPQQQRRQGEGGGEGNAAARFDSLIASSLSFTIALIALTASMPLPPSKGLKICIFHLILGFVVLLSSALPNMVRWLPYFSCIRPLFHLLPPRLQLRILHFSQILWDAIRRYVAFLFHMLPRPFQLRILQFSESSLNVIRLLVTVDASPPHQHKPTSTWTWWRSSTMVVQILLLPLWCLKIPTPSKSQKKKLFYVFAFKFTMIFV